MANIEILGKTFVPYIDKEAIATRVAEMGRQLSADYAGKNPLVIAILNGAFIFAADLFRAMDITATISFVKLASYKGTTSTGHVITAIGLEENISGRHVLIVEDIVDTGKTLSSFLPELQARQPASIQIATFLSKPDARTHEVTAAYTAFEIKNRFVVGYGLDYDGYGRNLPELYVLGE